MKIAGWDSDWKIAGYNSLSCFLVWFLNIHSDSLLEEMFQFSADKDGFFGKIKVSYRKLRRRIQLSIFLIYPI
jgi:hypothetical protein